MKLLVVEDERRMRELLRAGLCEEGNEVLCAADGHEALALFHDHRFDAAILDVMMPKMDGFELASRMRAENNHTPLLMLTAKDTVPDIVAGLDLGADDYMTKPFSFNELLLRLSALQRSAAIRLPSTMQVADLFVDTATHRVTRGGKDVRLTRTEYTLLERLLSNAGRVVPREMLILAVWGRQDGIEDNTLDAFVRLLRNKIDGEGSGKLIHTVRGVGYVIRPEMAS
jgi:DNA-binding response OmpR family regulator